MPDSHEPLPTHDDDAPLPAKTRAQVVRDILIFQVKLFADGVRDVLLSPISLLMGAIGLFSATSPGEPFYRLLRIGRDTERWIDLFGAAYREDDDDTHRDPPRDLESLLRDLETQIKEQELDHSAREGVARMRAALKKYF